MALQKTTTGALSSEMKTFYDKLLLERTVPQLLYSKFAQERPIPANGGKIIEFRKFDAIATATTPLTEGTPPSLKDLTMSAITATVDQYGDAIGVTDLLSTTTIDPILVEIVQILSEQAAETIDELVRDVLVAGTTVLYASTHTARNQIVASSILTPQEIRRAVLQLKLNRARKIDGFYQAIIHPRTEMDLINSDEWREAQVYGNNAKGVFDGSIGTLYGVKFWVTDKAKVWADAGAGSTVDVFGTIFLGQNAYASVKLAGHNLKTYHKPLGSAGTADPIDQQQSFGWKVAFVTKIIQDAFMLRLEHATSTASN